MMRMRYVGYTILERSRRLPSTMTADDELGGVLTTKVEIKVYPGKVVCEVVDENVEWEPIDLTDSPLGRVLLAAERDTNEVSGSAPPLPDDTRES